MGINAIRTPAMVMKMTISLILMVVAGTKQWQKQKQANKSMLRLLKITDAYESKQKPLNWWLSFSLLLILEDAFVCGGGIRGCNGIEHTKVILYWFTALRFEWCFKWMEILYQQFMFVELNFHRSLCTLTQCVLLILN